VKLYPASDGTLACGDPIEFTTLRWIQAKVTSAGESSMSTNPIVDCHIIYALALIALALTYAGHTWGLGRLWARLPFVQRNRWLI
jgi:thiosulfate dehydrogenase [quinone] large subunit